MSNLRIWRVKTKDLGKAINLDLITEDDVWTQGEIETELTLTQDQFENYSNYFEICLIG